MSTSNGIPMALPPDDTVAGVGAGGGSAADRFLGLAGAPGQLAKFGLAGVMAGLLCYVVVSGRQDTVAIRSEAAEAHKGMAVMTDVLRETRDGTRDLTHAIKGLSAEVRRLKEAQQGQQQAKDRRPDERPEP